MRDPLDALRDLMDPNPDGWEDIPDDILAESDHVLDGVTCWCRPYRDPEDPEVIVHRPEAKA